MSTKAAPGSAAAAIRPAAFSVTARSRNMVVSSSISDHKEIRDLAKDLGLTLDDVLKAKPPNTRSLYVFNDRPYNLADATRDWQPLYPILQAQNTALGEYSYQGRQHRGPSVRRP